ncbi:MAG: hypothetical protein SF029_08815 [bacterium]|nr:hypothetical protein [bacterium]
MSTPATTSSPNRRVRLRLLVSVVLVFLALVGGLLVYLYAQTRQSPIQLGAPSGELAFTSNQNGDWDVYLLDTAGQQTRLTAEGEEQDYFASWSFEGDMINFLTNRAGEMGPGQVGPEATGLRTLSIAEAITSLFFEGRLDWDPAWTPADENGEVRVLWASLRDLNLELYTRIGGSEEVQRLTSGGARDWFPAWSPDGTRLLFASDRDGNENIYVINADGSGLTALTDDPMDDIYPVWSLDGQTILFVSERQRELKDGFLDLYVMNADGSDQHLLAEGEVFRGDPTFTADGAQVAFMSNEEGDWNLYLVDADEMTDPDAPSLRRLTESDRDELFPAWRPVPEDNSGE